MLILKINYKKKYFNKFLNKKNSKFCFKFHLMWIFNAKVNNSDQGGSHLAPQKQVNHMQYLGDMFDPL